MKKQSRGFTLLELMITLVVLAVVISIAAPNLSGFLKRSATQSQTDYILGMLNYARSEAARLNSPVTVCKSNSGTGCVSGTTWTVGSIVFADADADGTVDAGEQILKVITSDSDDYLITPTADFANRITFRATGEASNVNTALTSRFVICPSTGETAYGREVIVSAVGRPRLHSGLTSNCNAT